MNCNLLACPQESWSKELSEPYGNNTRFIKYLLMNYTGEIKEFMETKWNVIPLKKKNEETKWKEQITMGISNTRTKWT